MKRARFPNVDYIAVLGELAVATRRISAVCHVLDAQIAGDDVSNSRSGAEPFRVCG